MIDKAKVTQAVSEMTENPDWKDVLMNAPGAANLRIALAFYASKNLDSMSQQEKDEYREFREMLEAQLNAEELKYLVDSFDRMGVEAAKTHYQELLEKKGGEGAPTSAPASPSPEHGASSGQQPGESEQAGGAAGQVTTTQQQGGVAAQGQEG